MADANTQSNTQWINPKLQHRLVSVIIPTYNRADMITDTLDSLWQQTYRPVEVVVVDDGSDDTTSDQVIGWHSQCQGDQLFFLQYVYQQNKGPSAARNLGIRKARGEYIYFLDSDDTLYPDMLKRAVEVFTETGCDAVHVGFEKTVEKKRGCTNSSYVPVNQEPLSAFLQGKLWGNCIGFIRTRELVGRVGPWDEAMFNAEDLDYALRTLVLANHVVSIGEVLCSYSVNSKNSLNKRKHTDYGWKCLLKSHARFIDMLSWHEIEEKNIQVYASSLFYKGVNASGMGFPKIGKEFLKLAERLPYKQLSLGGHRMRLLLKMGYIYCLLWTTGRESKRNIKKKMLTQKK